MTQVAFVRRIAARPAIVFDALVTAEGIGSWWGPGEFPAISAEADARVSGKFRVRFRTDDGLEHECAGEFLEIERPERVVMSWRWTSGGVIGERDSVSRLEICLRSIESGTELALVHTCLSSKDSAREHARGWEGALDKLLRRFSAKDCGPSN